MARLRPTSVASLLTVKGVGARKADELGDTFLAAIRAHSSFADSVYVNRTGFIGGPIPREDGAHATTQQVFSRAA